MISQTINIFPIRVLEYTLFVRYLNNTLILMHGCFINRGVAHDISSGCMSVCTSCQRIWTGVPIKEGRYDRVLSDHTSTGLVSVLLLSTQCTADFYEEKHVLGWLSESASKYPDTHGIIYIRRCCGKEYRRKVFDPDKFGESANSYDPDDLEKSLCVCTLNRSYRLLYIYGKGHWRFPIPEIFLFFLLTTLP